MDLQNMKYKSIKIDILWIYRNKKVYKNKSYKSTRIRNLNSFTNTLSHRQEVVIQE